MSKRFYTVLVLSDDSTKSKQFKVPVSLYNFARVALLIVILAVGYISYDYGSMRVKSLEFNELKQRNITQKIELNEISRKVAEVEGHLAKLKIFDKKLRILANIEVPNVSGDAQMGMGGASLDDVNFVTPRDKRDELVEKMHADLTQIESEAAMQERSFIELQSYISEQSSLLASTPSVWPTRGWVSSVFGKRTSPFTGLKEKHSGLDIANRRGTAISSTADGIVVYSGRKSALGKAVIIKHGYGLKTTFGHLSKILVKKGQKVKRGDKIGEMGNTGRSTGPHLHYNVSLNGVSVNPMKYILN